MGLPQMHIDSDLRILDTGTMQEDEALARIPDIHRRALQHRPRRLWAMRKHANVDVDIKDPLPR